MMDNPEKNAEQKNPIHELILKDIKSRSDWATKDSEIIRRRLCEKKKRKTKPYKGAPNSIVPIVDDVVTELTDQQVTMIMNAPVKAHIIPLQPMPPDLRAQAEQMFDTYLVHVINFRPKVEESIDTKYCRGLSNLMVRREMNGRFGEIPSFDTVDPKDIIVPPNTKEIGGSSRICHVLRLDRKEMKDRERDYGWANVDAILEKALAAEKDTASGSEDENSPLKEVESIVGLSTSDDNAEVCVMWEVWYYADEWAVKKDTSGTVKLGRKCCITFSPDCPELVAKSYAVKEQDQVVALSPEEQIFETAIAIANKRQPVLTKTIDGKDKPWPFIQPRYEYRSRYYYDSRGVGHKCMDDQIVATATQNAKLVMMDYFANPMLKGNGPDNSSNFTAEPGAYMPKDMEWQQPPSIPATFDFTVDYYKREAGRRSGAGSQYLYSGQVAQTRKIQKTKAEVDSEDSRVGVVSSAAVDRFNDPWRDLYQQLWDDLRRMRKVLPIISNGKFAGMCSEKVFDFNVLLVPASSSKTLNPDMQFNKAVRRLSLLKDAMSVGAVVDYEGAVKHVLSFDDPFFADQYIRNPNQPGPQGQPPVYVELQNIKKALAALATVVDQKGAELGDVQKLSIEHDNEIAKQKRTENVLALAKEKMPPAPVV